VLGRGELELGGIAMLGCRTWYRNQASLVSLSVELELEVISWWVVGTKSLLIMRDLIDHCESECILR
jgi:hypothetical protein